MHGDLEEEEAAVMEEDADDRWERGSDDESCCREYSGLCRDLLPALNRHYPRQTGKCLSTDPAMRLLRRQDEEAEEEAEAAAAAAALGEDVLRVEC